MLKFPWVSRKKYDAILVHSAKVHEEVGQAYAALVGRNQELEKQLAELTAPGEDIKRAIAEVEGRITVAELEAKLKKMQEPEPDDDSPRGRPSVDRVLQIASRVREEQKAGKK